MDIESFKRFYIDTVDFEEEQPLPEIFKQQSVLNISPEESDALVRSTVTFSQKNLDIHCLYSQSYVYCCVDVNLKTNGADDELNASHTDYTTDDLHFATTAIPSSAGLFSGYSYKVNDIDVEIQNNNLQSQLYVLNSGKFAEDNKLEQFTGLSVPEKGPLFHQKHKAAGKIEFYIPLRYVVPYLKNDTIHWGVKHSLTLTKASIEQAFYLHDPAFTGLTNVADKVNSLTFTKMRWHIPYIRLQPDKQLALQNKLYNTTHKYYYLSCDQYFSSPIANDVAQNGEVIRITSKSVNSRPRYLIVSAIDNAVSTTINNTSVPLGFTTATTNPGAQNNLVVKSMRIKLNGIYIDAGDVMSFENVDIAAAGTDPRVNHTGYFRAYELYCKFFNLQYSGKNSPVSFEDWLSHQIYVFDLTQIDTEQIFLNSSNTIITELELSTYRGSSTAGKQIKLCMNMLFDRSITISHNNNTSLVNAS
jgi:hypothetical protein